MAIYACHSPRGDLVSFANCARLVYEPDGRECRFSYSTKAPEEDSTDGGSCSSDLESATSGSVSAQTSTRPSIPRDWATNGAREGNCVPVCIRARLTPRVSANYVGADRRGTNPSTIPQAFEHMPAKVRPSPCHVGMRTAHLNPSLPAKKFPRYLADFPNMTLKSQRFDSRAPLKKGVTSFLSTDMVFTGISELLCQKPKALGYTSRPSNVLGTQAPVSPRYAPSR
eukprot:TRINITY_DN69353_c0_g1_i1.p1 TRINITY_DN69353_c0_g1~~TRINITY_DN69353_c0_g1_i1.p1  ORF type:complete len:257 (-),score=16.18 TRINITY_DN69353_c0_g1_i1:135-812(-)